MSRGFCTKIWYIGLFFCKNGKKLTYQLVCNSNQDHLAGFA